MIELSALCVRGSAELVQAVAASHQLSCDPDQPLFIKVSIPWLQWGDCMRLSLRTLSSLRPLLYFRQLHYLFPFRIISWFTAVKLIFLAKVTALKNQIGTNLNGSDLERISHCPSEWQCWWYWCHFLGLKSFFRNCSGISSHTVVFIDLH